MAAAKESVAYRRNSQYTSRMYVYGNNVRQAEELPEEVYRTQRKRQKKVSRQVRKNRRRAMSISPSYAAFLIVAAVAAVVICMGYLKLQTDLISRSEHITAMQEELANLTEQNDTALQAAEDSVNLEEVRNKAINQLGMVYSSQGSVVEYESPTSGYVKQYSDIPKNGVLGKDADATR